jgi:uncharacterized phiE125 gp8 family phage protein
MMESQNRYIEVDTPAADPAVTLANAKDHLHVTDTDSDAYIPLLVTLATRIYEERANTSLCTQTLILHLDRFPVNQGPIYLPRGPVQTVASLYYVNTSGTAVEFPTASYTVDINRSIATIRPAYGFTWPASREQDGAVYIEYDAGYGDDDTDLVDIADMPVHAIKLLVGHFFERRESTEDGVIHEVPETFDMLVNLDPHRYMPPQE